MLTESTRPRLRALPGPAIVLVAAMVLLAVVLAQTGLVGQNRLWPASIPADMEQLDVVVAGTDVSPKLAPEDARKLAASGAPELDADSSIPRTLYLVEDAAGTLLWVVRYEGVDFFKADPPNAAGSAGPGQLYDHAYTFVDDATGVVLHTAYLP